MLQAQIINALEKSYYQPEMKRIHKLFQEVAIKDPEHLKKAGLSLKSLNALKAKTTTTTNISKKKAIQLVLPIFESHEIFMAAWEIIDLPNTTRLLSALALGVEVDVGSMEKEYGFKSYTTIKNYYSVEVVPILSMSLFKIESSYWKAEKTATPIEGSKNYCTLSLPELMQPVILSLLPRPEHCKLQVLEDDDLKISWKKFSAEQEVFAVITNLTEAMRAGMLKLTSKGEVSEPSAKKMQTTFNIQEWYDKEDAPHKFMYPMRTRMLLQLLLLVKEEEKNISPDPIQALKQLFKHYSIGSYSHNYSFKGYKELAYLLPHLKGLNYVLDYDGFTSVATSLIEKYKQLPPNQWITTENLNNYLLYEGASPKPIGIYEASRYVYYYKYYEDDYKEKSYINRSNYEELITIPMLKASVALMASIGLLDIAYNTPKPFEEVDGAVSYFDGVMAVKLNPLGQYILGLSNHYEAAVSEDAATVTLSSEDLMLLLSKEDLMKEKTLAFYATQLSPLRFHLSSASFLKDCKTKADLRQRISNFKITVGQQKLPLIWENFFKDLLQKALTLEEIEDVVIYQLPADNPELLKLIATSPDFQKVINKAEGYRILVEKGQVRKFKSLLSAAGYLLS